MTKKRFVIFLITILSICILGYYLYPKNEDIGKLLFSNYQKENIEKIEIRSTSSRQDRSIKDKDKINEILYNISNIKLVRYYGSTVNRTKGSIHIYIYDESKVTTEIIIQGKEYINIINNYDNFNKEYKIIDNSLDLDYINRLIS
ncbi:MULTISPECIES: hypothetical protein [unclassified Clostridium]|uniref:hypothetical protein n=1 Tax=unclassified Clostridium TaxID=2614128 RepID=UPI00023AF26B|nr:MULTISPECIES: hypothetical protein [unclassified Clostridium]EHI98270.1 hypothetical protein CDLVIII_1579 [Clostridium sp. DL-VIII]OOM77652.1 hypothetical protein CLOBL_27930 [Clostridium sp. BL-8]